MMPREKLLSQGPESLSDAELLSIFLGTGVRDVSVVQLANQFLARFDGLRGLMQCPGREILEAPGIGAAKAAQLAGALEVSRRYLNEQLERGVAICGPNVTRDFLRHDRWCQCVSTGSPTQMPGVECGRCDFRA